MFNVKKTASILAAATLMMGVSTSAFAAFADNNLIQVYYERETGTTEAATNLGSVTSITTAGTTTTSSATTISSLGTISDSNNVYAAYFAINRTTGEMWVSGSTDTTLAPVAVGSKGYTPYMSGTTNVFSNYNAIDTDHNGTVVGSQSNGNAYVAKLTASQGAMANAINIDTRAYTETSLASLVDGTATSTTAYLYYFANGKDAGSVGVAVKQIVTAADGSITISDIPTASTPIPAAIYLMGSGLLGLVGIRRRKNS